MGILGFRFQRLSVLALILLVGGCSKQNQTAASGKLKVTTTTSMVTDLVKNIGGEKIEVQGLMGAGVDPHLYKATASDIAKLQQADVIFYNGLLLEGKMEDVFSRMKESGRKIYAITDGISKDRLLKPDDMQGHHDPHVWFDVEMWELCAQEVEKGLRAADAANADYYTARSVEFRSKLKDLHAWAKTKTQELPEEKRVLITSHDAYNYFGRAYGFQVVGLQGISTVTEPGLADMAKMVDYIKKKGVKAIFVESSVPPNTINRISNDAGVKVGGELFSDAMGTPGQIENGYDLGTYEGMVKHNINTIVDALK